MQRDVVDKISKIYTVIIRFRRYIAEAEELEEWHTERFKGFGFKQRKQSLIVR